MPYVLLEYDDGTATPNELRLTALAVDAKGVIEWHKSEV